MALSFAPNGLQATQTVTAASWSGQTQTFTIGQYTPEGKWNGYDNNIFAGDVVALSAGSLVSAGTVTTGIAPGAVAVVHPIGVFTGCSFTSTPNTNSGFNTTSSGSPMYLSGTTGYNDGYVKGQIISDPNIIYTVLVAGNTPAAPQPLTVQERVALMNGAGGVALISVPILDTGAAGAIAATDSIKGNTTLGVSKAFISMASFTAQGQQAPTIAVANGNTCVYVNIIGVSANPQLNLNVANDDFLFVEVQLANHFYNRTVTGNAVVTSPSNKEGTSESVQDNGVAKKGVK